LQQIELVPAKTDRKIVDTFAKSTKIARFRPTFAKLLHYGNNEAENIQATTGYATSCRFLSETGS
jgi:predicted glycosyltransferase